MRVAVKNMSGVFIHSTTPRKARLLLKEKKAVIESNNPFTIRLLFSESECGLKDSESLNKLESDLASEKDRTMCDDRKEIEEAIKQQKQTDKNNSEKENIMSDELHIPKTHLIFGYYGCGKTTYIRQLINDKIQNCLGVCVLTNAYSAKLYFNKEDKNLHISTIASVLAFLPDKEKNPINIAKAIVDCFVANVGRFNIDTIAVDGMDIVIPSINSDYSEDEYFRELSKCCKNNKFNLLYTKGISKIENDSSYHKIPTVFERFSDIITVLK